MPSFVNEPQQILREVNEWINECKVVNNCDDYWRGELGGHDPTFIRYSLSKLATCRARNFAVANRGLP